MPTNALSLICMHIHAYICIYMHPCTCLGRLPKNPPKSPKSHAHGHKTMLAQHHEVRYHFIFKALITHSDIIIHILPACSDNILPRDLYRMHSTNSLYYSINTYFCQLFTRRFVYKRHAVNLCKPAVYQSTRHILHITNICRNPAFSSTPIFDRGSKLNVLGFRVF